MGQMRQVISRDGGFLSREKNIRMIKILLTQV